MSGTAASTSSDVVVIGGGLAGKAAALQLARAGLRVTCIEPAEAVRQAVGESLDWSAPDLLSALGLPMEELVEHQDGDLEAACHTEVTRWLFRALCSDALARWRRPSTSSCGLCTWIASASTRNSSRLTIDSGVNLVRDKVVRVERNGKKISAVQTAGGARLSSPWFIDASGFATCLLAREFNLPGHSLRAGEGSDVDVFPCH